MTPDHAPLTGRHLGSYQVLALLGAGGMGEVYRAHDAKLGRDVAIKVLPPGVAGDVDRLNVSNESGADEVYVRSFPGMGNKTRVSTEGGTEPSWTRDGSRLIFVSPRRTPQGGRLAIVELTVGRGPALTLGPPRTLFELDQSHYSLSSQARGYDVASDASRFVFVHETYPAQADALGAVHYVDHWFDELRAKVR